ncbi:MAG: EAL domain-containing protein [Chloroflexota bacterium]|nr:EAL domain-containing protein [Chloroflexota bacterium]
MEPPLTRVPRDLIPPRWFEPSTLFAALAVCMTFGFAALAAVNATEGWQLGELLVASFMAAGLLSGLALARQTRTTNAMLEAERARVRESEQRFQSLVQNSSDAITVVDAESTIQYESPSVESLLGYASGSLVGTRILDLVHPEDRDRARIFLSEASSRTGLSDPIEWRWRHDSGLWVHVESVASNLLHDVNWNGLVLNTRSITERKALEQQLKHQALHDPLTDLPNRALFTDRVDHALARARRREGHVAVLFLDLDNFKTTNDSFGHAAGDQLLRAVAERLQATVRPSDTAARLGGDEFAILIEDVAHAREAIRSAERLMKALSTPIDLTDKRVSVNASIGIAVSEPGQQHADELLRNADLAMYVAKGHGKGRYEVFKSSMHAAVVERAQTEEELQHAVDRQEFTVHYQPIVSLPTGGIVGLEALVRWKHPERGLLPPGAFLPLAEEMGLIIPIGRRVLRQAVRQARVWQVQYRSEPPIWISINVSSQQLAHAEFIDDVRQALDESGLAPRDLVLEVSEAGILRDADASVARLLRLKELGVRIALDNFGTGYASLGFLQRLPVDLVKIDRSLVEGLGIRDEAAPLVTAIMTLARSLELGTVAEGIERRDQLERLMELGCRIGQGHHFAKALASDAIGSLFIAPFTPAHALKTRE